MGHQIQQGLSLTSRKALKLCKIKPSYSRTWSDYTDLTPTLCSSVKILPPNTTFSFCGVQSAPKVLVNFRFTSAIESDDNTSTCFVRLWLILNDTRTTLSFVIYCTKHRKQGKTVLFVKFRGDSLVPRALKEDVKSNMWSFTTYRKLGPLRHPQHSLLFRSCESDAHALQRHKQ